MEQKAKSAPDSSLQRFGATTKLLLTIGSHGRNLHQFEAGQFKYVPQGVAVNPVDGSVWVSSHTRVHSFSADGVFQKHVASDCVESRGIAFAANGEAYVADIYEHLVAVCGPDGSVSRRIRGSGGGVEMFKPYYVAIDNAQGLLFISATINHRVQVLKLDGSFVRTFGGEGKGDGQFDAPHGIALSAAGEVAVTDQTNRTVQVFDYNGKFLRKLGNGWLRPSGVAADVSRNWLVCEQANRFNRLVQVFAADGKFITAFGQLGYDTGQLYQPTCICVDCEGRILVGDGGYRVQVFAFCSGDRE